MTGISAVVIQRAFMLADLADMAAALTVEALCGVDDAFDPLVHSIRPHPGQIDSAKNIRGHLQGSRLVNSIPNRIQDAYSLRCTPQVHGAIRDALEYAARTVGREMNSVTDNPLIFSHPDRAISGGNFHGEPIAISMDTAGIALAEMADISERRIAKLLDSSTNEGLPMFLIPPEKAGLNSGLMILQYTAASLVSENKVLAHPASVDSIPTSANQEDHVSMGTIASRKAWSILKNSENVLAVEFLAAAQAIDFRDPGKLGKGTKKAYQFIRSLVPKVIQDREMASDISRIRENFPKLLKSFESEPVVWKLGSLLKK
jgi:histidine ammonia-lyase